MAYSISKITQLQCRHHLILIGKTNMFQWRNRLARGTYNSSTSEKCRGCEFEPHLEQIILKMCLHLFYIFSMSCISGTNQLAEQLSWLERRANNANVQGSTPCLVIYFNWLYLKKKSAKELCLPISIGPPSIRLFTDAVPLLLDTEAFGCLVSHLAQCTSPQTTWMSLATQSHPCRCQAQYGHPIAITRS